MRNPWISLPPVSSMSPTRHIALTLFLLSWGSLAHSLTLSLSATRAPFSPRRSRCCCCCSFHTKSNEQFVELCAVGKKAYVLSAASVYALLVFIKYRAARYFKFTKEFRGNTSRQCHRQRRSLKIGRFASVSRLVLTLRHRSRLRPENNGFLRLGKFIEKNEKTYSHSIRRSYELVHAFLMLFEEVLHSHQFERYNVMCSTHWESISNALQLHRYVYGEWKKSIYMQKAPDLMCSSCNRSNEVFSPTQKVSRGSAVLCIVLTALSWKRLKEDCMWRLRFYFPWEIFSLNSAFIASLACKRRI